MTTLKQKGIDMKKKKEKGVKGEITINEEKYNQKSLENEKTRLKTSNIITNSIISSKNSQDKENPSQFDISIDKSNKMNIIGNQKEKIILSNSNIDNNLKDSYKSNNSIKKEDNFNNNSSIDNIENIINIGDKFKIPNDKNSSKNKINSSLMSRLREVKENEINESINEFDENKEKKDIFYKYLAIYLNKYNINIKDNTIRQFLINIKKKKIKRTIILTTSAYNKNKNKNTKIGKIRLNSFIRILKFLQKKEININIDVKDNDYKKSIDSIRKEFLDIRKRIKKNGVEKKWENKLNEKEKNKKEKEVIELIEYLIRKIIYIKRIYIYYKIKISHCKNNKEKESLLNNKKAIIYKEQIELDNICNRIIIILYEIFNGDIKKLEEYLTLIITEIREINDSEEDYANAKRIYEKDKNEFKKLKEEKNIKYKFTLKENKNNLLSGNEKNINKEKDIALKEKENYSVSGKKKNVDDVILNNHLRKKTYRIWTIVLPLMYLGYFIYSNGISI